MHRTAEPRTAKTVDVSCQNGIQSSSFSLMSRRQMSAQRIGNTPVGVTPREARPFGRSERWFLCPAYTIDGFMTREIVHGSFSAELYEDFIENKVLRLHNPYPLPRSVIVMDIAPIHRTEVP